MQNAALSGLLAGYGIAVPVGAIAVVLISLSARTSVHIGAAAGLGAATVDGTYALIAVAGGGGLARLGRAAADPLHWAAATVLTILAVRTAVIAVRRYRSRACMAGPAVSLSTPLRAYTALIGLTALTR
jgi:arginine exporter protein ArgO